MYSFMAGISFRGQILAVTSSFFRSVVQNCPQKLVQNCPQNLIDSISLIVYNYLKKNLSEI